MMYHRQIGNTSSRTSYDVIRARKGLMSIFQFDHTGEEHNYILSSN